MATPAAEPRDVACRFAWASPQVSSHRADHRDPAAYERLTFFAVFLLVGTTAAQLAAFVL